jgi:hypothetical protein
MCLTYAGFVLPNPTQASDIIILDIPRRDVIEVSLSS